MIMKIKGYDEELKGRNSMNRDSELKEEVCENIDASSRN